jgi:hypothetical protein
LKKGMAASRLRTYTASSNVDWIVSTRSYPGEPRFTDIKTLVKVFCSGGASFRECKGRTGPAGRQEQAVTVMRVAKLS